MRPSAREFAEFNGLLSSVVEKGMPLPPAVELMAGVVRHRELRQALQEAAASLKEGASLPDALARHPGAFPSEYVALVRTGNDSGRLSQALRTAQVHHSFRAQLHGRLRRLFLYLLGGLIIGEIVLLMMVFVGDQFERTFLVFEQELQVRNHSDFGSQLRAAARSTWMMMIAFPIGCALMAGAYWVLQRWARAGWLGYALPVWGAVQKSRDLALFCCSVGLRLRGGAPLPEAIVAGRDAVYNRRFRRLADEVLRRVQEGESLSSSLYYQKFFPKTLAWGVSLGEENGEVPRTFDTFTELYTAQMERSFEVVFQVLTPLGILAVGNVALVAALMILTPFLELIRLSMTMY